MTQTRYVTFVVQLPEDAKLAAETTKDLMIDGPFRHGTITAMGLGDLMSALDSYENSRACMHCTKKEYYANVDVE